jgi:hypothetical protein
MSRRNRSGWVATRTTLSRAISRTLPTASRSGARGDLGDLGRGSAGDVRGQLGQQLVLALDVVVERGTGDAERVGDILQARPGEAALGEQPDRLLVYLVLDQFPASGGGTGRLPARAR